MLGDLPPEPKKGPLLDPRWSRVGEVGHVKIGVDDLLPTTTVLAGLLGHTIVPSHKSPKCAELVQSECLTEVYEHALEKLTNQAWTMVHVSQKGLQQLKTLFNSLQPK